MEINQRKFAFFISNSLYCLLKFQIYQKNRKIKSKIFVGGE
jgi:hypothetical protein